MDRTAATGKAVDLYGSGKHGFEDKDVGAGKAGTEYIAADQNAHQEEIVRVIEAFGLTPSAADLGQLAEAMGDGEHGYFGDGSDGDLSTVGNVTLTADTFYNDLTVNAGHTVFTRGFILHVAGTLLVKTGGRVTNAGDNGQDGASGITGGASYSNTLRDGTDGGDAGTSAFNGSNASAPAESLGGQGGGGGDGNGGGTTGGNGGAATPPAANEGAFRSLPSAATGMATGYNGGAGIVWVRGGGGGGGGGGGATDNGGAGGGAGAVLVVRAARIVIEAGGNVDSNGGNGGAAAPGGDGGGGGGGGAGYAALIYRTLSNSGNIEATGGIGGAKDGTGVAGTDGTDGTVIQLKA